MTASHYPATTPLPGGYLLVAPTDVAHTRKALAYYERAHRRDGIGFSPGLSEFQAKVHQAAALAAVTSASGPLDVRTDTVSPTWVHDEISIAEAADLLGCSPRHANRLARAGHLGATRKVAGRRLVSRTDVTAHLTDKESPAP